MNRSRICSALTVAVAVALAPAIAHAQARGTVTGKVTVHGDGGAKSSHAGTVVYVEGVPVGDARTLVMYQKELQFTPQLMVVATGTTIDFANEDKVFHNVFSLSQTTKFDLGLYKSGTSKAVTFKRPGVIDVYCNIHSEMRAAIKVVDTPAFAMTADDGSFQITGVPPGSYAVVAWRPGAAEVRGKITVAAGRPAQVTLSIEDGKITRRHLRKDGTPYGRYK
jgi:plastocyanin